MSTHKITPLFILDYSNPLYNDGHPPSDDASRQAFGNFAVAGLRRFKGRNILWELWNEPDLSYSWNPPNPENYALLAVAVGQAIRKDPEISKEIFMGPALSGFNYSFFDTVMKGGVLEYFDYVSIHGYWANPPEQWVSGHDHLTTIIRKYQPAGKNIQVICSEWGHANTEPGFNLNIQAYWLVRQYLATLYTQAPTAIWYDWIDDGTDPNNIQDHFGTVYNRYYPDRNPVYDKKPAYDAANTFMHVLQGRRFHSAVLNARNSYVYYFIAEERGVSSTVFVAWTSNNAKLNIGFSLPTNLAAGQCFDSLNINGTKSSTPVCADNGRVVTLEVTESPVYLVWRNSIEDLVF